MVLRVSGSVGYVYNAELQDAECVKYRDRAILL